ncbi:hypothetical protein ABZ897_33995 [Nonomuraea sp. NPDC046802]|uniref:YciI family protein n=1 Tax=Nonomuraea sp. NPDC046802 TaxID=3154919 RepID=UPI0033C4B560
MTGGLGLRPAAEATTVRVRGGQVPLCDGPFAETEDQIGGFALIGCAGLEFGARISAAPPGAGH